MHTCNMLTLNFVDFCDAHNKHISLTRTWGKNSRPKNVGGIPQKRRRCVVWRIETTDDMDDLAVNIMVMALNICILYSAFADKFVCGLTILKQDRSANRLSPICENKQKRLPPQKNTYRSSSAVGEDCLQFYNLCSLEMQPKTPLELKLILVLI